jgi:hypothetical protein
VAAVERLLIRLIQVMSLTRDTCGLIYEEKNTNPVTAGMENLDMSVTNLVVPSTDIIEMVCFMQWSRIVSS